MIYPFILLVMGVLVRLHAAVGTEEFLKNFLEEWKSSRITPCLIVGASCPDISPDQIVRRSFAMMELEWMRILRSTENKIALQKYSPQDVSDVQWIHWGPAEGPDFSRIVLSGTENIDFSKKVLCVSMGSDAFNCRADMTEIKNKCYKFVEGEQFNILMQHLLDRSRPVFFDL